MIQITADQIERVNLILSGVPKGAEKAMASVIRRANNTVRSEALKGITSVYAITRQNVRAGGAQQLGFQRVAFERKQRMPRIFPRINRTGKADGGIKPLRDPIAVPAPLGLVIPDGSGFLAQVSVQPGKIAHAFSASLAAAIIAVGWKKVKVPPQSVRAPTPLSTVFGTLS